MIDGKNVLAIIPARSGSKGLPGKNIKDLCGKPLINWSIDSAKNCKYVDDIYVSTDSNDIANVARTAGVEIKKLRPQELASDTASSMDVVRFSIEDAEVRYKKNYDFIVLLEPTSPLRESVDIDSALESLINNPDAEAITGVCKVEDQHPSFLVKLNSHGFHEQYLQKDKADTYIRRQDVSELYFHEGSLYIARKKQLLENNTFYTYKTLGYVMPKWKSLEIDDIYDFYMVEAMIRANVKTL